jgi:hypothetical protein
MRASPRSRCSAWGASNSLRFAGLPLGHEFTSLVLALLWTGGHPPKVEPEVIEQIQALDGDFNFEVYMSLSCHNCPDVVQALSPHGHLQPEGQDHRDRRRRLPGRGQRPRDHGRAHGLPERHRVSVPAAWVWKKSSPSSTRVRPRATRPS